MASDKKNHHALILKGFGNACTSTSNLSPMTDLAQNLESLTTVNQGTHVDTPKRRISWGSSVGTPTPDPKSIDSPDPSALSHSPSIAENRLLTDISNEPKKTLFTRLRQPSKEQFTAVLQRKEAFRNSPVKENLPSILKSIKNKEKEKLDSEAENSSALPHNFSTLLNSRLVTPNKKATDRVQSSPIKTVDKVKGKSCIRGLFRDGGDASGQLKAASKRSESCRSDTPVLHLSKRRKAVSICSTKNPFCSTENSCSKYQRSYSETQATTIMKAVQLSSENPDLIGDFSRPYSLPLVASKHEDLKSISAQTVTNLLRGQFNSVVTDFVIIDCRFPYEFEGGHIQGARNIFTKDELLEHFFSPSNLAGKSKSTVLIFHCEFSSERGPSLTRFLRNIDRESNEYPNLHYPEIYVLNGGYKAFYEGCKELCEPQGYKPMLHRDHEQDLKLFRARSKSWNAETKTRVVVRPGLKF